MAYNIPPPPPAGEDKPVDGVQTKALTEEDVHNWKHRLRNSKSAESLLSMATSARSSISSQASSSMSYADGRRHRGMCVGVHVCVCVFMCTHMCVCVCVCVKICADRERERKRERERSVAYFMCAWM